MSDILNMEKINSLGPIIVELSGSTYDLEFVCVQTGCARINVMGLGQNVYWTDFSKIFDWDMTEYDPDSFYCDYEGDL